MMLTSWPAARSASASCHTRRSNGQGRFSTMMRTRHLPGDAVIGVIVGVVFGGAEGADEVDEGFLWGELLKERGELAVGAGEHYHLRVLEKLLRPIDHQPPDMGDVIEDVLAIGAHEARQAHVAVIHAQLVPLADELFR